MVISGRVALLLLLGVVAVVLRPGGGTAALWVLGVLLLVAVDRLATPSPAALRVQRAEPGTIRLGDDATSTLEITHPGARRMRLQVRDAWQPSAGAHANRHRRTLEPHATWVATTPMHPVRRGDLHAAGVTIRSWGPLGLAGTQRTRQVPGTVRALPAFPSRKHLPSRLARLRELDGRAAVRVRGPGTEFDSLREYVRGDDVRSIDWRASARSPEVVVRTWQPERDRRVVLVLDTARTSAGRVSTDRQTARELRGLPADQHDPVYNPERDSEHDTEAAAVPRLDAAMDAALLLGVLAARAGDRVDLVAGDFRVRARERVGGSRDAAGRLSEAMADLTPVLAETDWDLMAGAVQGLGRQRALVVLLTAAEPAVVGGLLPVLVPLTRHHRVVVASVRDPGLAALATLAPTSGPHARPGRLDADAVYDAAAAATEIARRDHAASLLERTGVHVLDIDAAGLAPALADHYLALKAQGLL